MCRRCCGEEALPGGAWTHNEDAETSRGLAEERSDNAHTVIAEWEQDERFRRGKGRGGSGRGSSRLHGERMEQQTGDRDGLNGAENDEERPRSGAREQ